MPNRPGRASAGLRGLRPPTASRVPPGPFFSVLAFLFPEFLHTFRQWLGQTAKESRVLAQGEPGLAVGGEAAGTGKERKKHFSHSSRSGNQKGCGMAAFGAQTRAIRLLGEDSANQQRLSSL